MPLSAVDPENYDSLLADKVERVRQLIAQHNPPEPLVYPSTTTAYRMRAEFRVWHEGDALDYVMFRRDDPKTPVRIKKFPIACQAIQNLMPALMAQLQPDELLRRKLFQVEFLSTLEGDTLVTLVYHRKLDEDWTARAGELAQSLDIQIIGRSRKQKVVVGRDYVTEHLPIDGRDYSYRQYEQAFTQPNARVNIHMIEWACAAAESLEDDLLELYCGNGNFTLPLSRHFDNVIATELAKSSARAARENLDANQIKNITMIRLSAEEVTQAMTGVREFRRLAELPMPLSEYKFNTVFVDPPRAGLDRQTEKMVSGFNTIIYISCNPETLAANLTGLSDSHYVERFALFDQFPYTHHMECGVVLKKHNRGIQ